MARRADSRLRPRRIPCRPRRRLGPRLGRRLGRFPFRLIDRQRLPEARQIPLAPTPHQPSQRQRIVVAPAIGMQPHPTGNDRAAHLAVALVKRVEVLIEAVMDREERVDVVMRHAPSIRYPPAVSRLASDTTHSSPHLVVMLSGTCYHLLR